MQVIFKDGSALTVTEIQGTRVTGTDANGKYVDRKVKHIAGFAGRVLFYGNASLTQYAVTEPEPTAAVEGDQQADIFADAAAAAADKGKPVPYNPNVIDYNNEQEEAQYLAVNPSRKASKA